MIISHAHRFVFFAVPKTATHTIREALRAHKAADDWEQQVLFGQQFLPIPELAAIGHGHISVRQLRGHLPPDTWNDYFKFAFVRNPFDRFVSICFFLNRQHPGFEKNARSFMKRALNAPRFRRRILVRPQTELLTDDDGELAVDFVGRYEALQPSYDSIMKKVGLATTDLEWKNKSTHAGYDVYYDDELREQVAEFYRDDLRMFGYGAA
jgi:hypothetical protein